jgi:hypothetical protein
MRKSFNVSVMANLPQSLFGSDPSVVFFVVVRSDGSEHVRNQLVKTHGRRDSAVGLGGRPWVCKPTSETQLFSVFPQSSFFAFRVFFPAGFHASLFYCFSTKGSFVFPILIMALSAAAPTSFFVCNLFSLCEVSCS